MQSSMFLVWVGALLIVGGVVLGATQAIRKGRRAMPIASARPAQALPWNRRAG